MASFGYVNNEFINLYTDDNPIIEKNEICYFLLTNNLDFHRPLICKGFIISDKFNDGMNKTYFIMCTEILETPAIIEKFFNGKAFKTITYDSENLIIKSGKTTIFPEIDENLFIENLFSIESFFVRNTYEKISSLRKEYIDIIKNDLINQITDIDLI